MDFDVTEEQEMLRASLARWLDDNYDLDRRRAIATSEAGWSEEVWSDLAELGLLAAPFAEGDGGLGLGPIETMLAMEQFGRALLVEPYFATVVLGGAFLRLGGSPAQRAELTPEIAAGALRLAFAGYEDGGRYDLARIQTRAEAAGSGWRLSGAKAVVLGAPMADRLIVTALTGEARMTAFLIDARAPGVSARDYPTVDGQRACDIVLNGVEAGPDQVLGAVDEGASLAARAVDEALAALCAEAVGAMGALFEATLDYAKERKQFGQPIARFQVIQHRLVDMRIALEDAQSLSIMASGKLAAGAPDASRAIAAAKSGVGRAATQIAQEAVQIHGGMGMTDEMPCGLFMKRLTMINHAFGDPVWHARRFAKL